MQILWVVYRVSEAVLQYLCQLGQLLEDILRNGKAPQQVFEQVCMRSKEGVRGMDLKSYQAVFVLWSGGGALPGGHVNRRVSSKEGRGGWVLQVTMLASGR